MAERNHRMLQEKRAQNEMIRTKAQVQALPDNRTVRKKLMGDWSSHLHKRGQSIDSYQAFKKPIELHAKTFQRQGVLFRC